MLSLFRKSSTVTLNDIADRHYLQDGTQKDRHYQDAYEEIVFPGRQAEHLALLELGVANGGSVLTWIDYLPNADIVAIDILQRPERIPTLERVHILRGSQDDTGLLDEAGRRVGRKFDVIVDDASHLGFLTERSFHHLFTNWLVPGGWYVIEDCGAGFHPGISDHGNYRKPPRPGADDKELRSHDYGTVGFLKQLVDHQMLHYSRPDSDFYPIARMDLRPHIVFIQKRCADAP